MKDIFAAIYETLFGLYNQTYDLIFTTLYNDIGYIKFGLIFIMVPILFWILFYYVWRYPYGNIWHWLLWLVLTCLTVSFFTWGIANVEILASSNPALINALASNSGYEIFASSLPLKYSIINGVLALIVSLLYSFGMKQFSKIQIHLPI